MVANMKKQLHDTTFALNCKKFFTNIYDKMNKINPARFYLVCAVALGGILIFVTPPFQVPDEGAHFYRAYQISEGGFLPDHITDGTGGWLPKSIQDTIAYSVPDGIYGDPDVKANLTLVKNELSRPLNADERIEIHFENTSLYSPIMYAPASLGIAVARVFGATPLVMLYIGRIFTLAAWVGMLYFAIRIIPFGKWTMTVLALTPMAIFQSASVSADAMAIGLTAVVIAWFVKLATQKTMITKKQWWLTVGLLFIFGFIKQPYSLMGVAFAFLPTRLFTAKKQHWQFVASVLAVIVGITVIWYVATRFYYSPPFWVTDRVIAPDVQLKFMLTHPLTLLKALFATHVMVTSDALIMQTIGVFGSLETPLPLWTDLMYMFCLLLAVGLSYGEKVMPKLQRLILFSLAALCFLAIDVLLYMSWSPIGGAEIWGLQGRYYLVALPGMIIAFIGSLDCKLRKLKSQSIIVSLMVIVLVTSLYVIVRRFWLV